MRNIVLLLLFTNLLLFAWQIWIVPPDKANPSDYPDASIPQLSVYSAANELVTGESAAQEEVFDETGERCVRVGPFTELSVANSVRDQLIDQATSIERTSEPGTAWVGHWVQVIDLGTREAAESAVAELVKAGIADAYIVQFEPTLDISLGVYRAVDRAKNIVDMAAGFGYTPVMEDRVRPTVEHWLIAKLTGDQALQLDDIQLASGQILRTERIACGTDEAQGDYQPPEPDSPLNGPVTSDVTQPP